MISIGRADTGGLGLRLKIFTLEPAFLDDSFRWFNLKDCGIERRSVKGDMCEILVYTAQPVKRRQEGEQHELTVAVYSTPQYHTPITRRFAGVAAHEIAEKNALSLRSVKRFLENHLDWEQTSESELHRRFSNILLRHPLLITTLSSYDRRMILFAKERCYYTTTVGASMQAPSAGDADEMMQHLCRIANHFSIRNEGIVHYNGELYHSLSDALIKEISYDAGCGADLLEKMTKHEMRRKERSRQFTPR